MPGEILGHSPLPQPPALWSLGEYRRFLADTWPRYHHVMPPADRVRLTTEYQSRLPLYAIARCPFCERPVAQHVDTFSLNGYGWDQPGAGYGWADLLGGQVPLSAHCPHVRIIAEYLNLNGKRPDDLFSDKVIQSGPEVPGIMEVPMRAPGARAVLHHLPVGRFDEDEPRPHYTVYFVTYFTETVAEYETATADWGVHYGRVGRQDVSYDLAEWVRAGRLLWLDPANPGLPLAAPDVAAFPYRDIRGDRWPQHIITHRGIERPRPSLAERILNLFDRRRPDVS